MSVAAPAPNPWLTVIIPCYRGERWIDGALHSIAAEDPAGVEVLLVDGSPSSTSRDIAAGYAERLSLRVFERPDLATWQTKTNFAVTVARSAHLCWLGVDDVWLPGRLAAVRQWLAADPEVALYLAPAAIIDGHGRRLGVWRCPLPAGVAVSSELVTARLLVQNFVAAPAPVFRRDAWLACGGLDESLWYTADWDLWLKLANSGAVRYHRDVTIGFRIHGESLTVTGSRNPEDFASQMQIVLNRHLPRLNGRARVTERAARASIVVNSALAAAAGGEFTGLTRALSQLLRLGPAGLRLYLRDSRLFERLAPRLRAKWAGSL